MSPFTRLRTACFIVCISFWPAGNSSRASEKTDFPAEARQRFERGQELRKKGQLQEAIGAFQDAITLGMDAFPRVHLQQAGTNLDLKNYDAAIAQFTKIIDDFGVEESCRY